MTTTTGSILVTGATGHVGRHLVAELRRAGASVRALTRRPDVADLPTGVDVVEGDFDSLPSGVFDGVEAAFIFPADGAVEFVKAAAAAQVPRLVPLSSLAAALEHERDHGSASQLHHAAIEEALRATEAEWTILRPGTFANNLLSWAPSIRYTGGVSGPYPTSAQAPIHEADVAAAAAAALLQPGRGGEIHAMTGPEALTRREQLAVIGTAIGRELTFTENSPEEFAAEMRQYGVGDSIITMLLDYWSDTVDQPDAVRRTELLNGRASRTLAEWARDHAADFA